MTNNSSIDVPEIVRILTASGFFLETVAQQAGYVVFKVRRRDEFDVSWRYLIAYSGRRKLSPNDVTMLERVARQDSAALIIVGATLGKHPNIPLVAPSVFLARLGGRIPSYLPLEREYPMQLTQLGHNSLPAGLVGRPDQLFEDYVEAGLEFLFQGRVIRYGQERRGEIVPDGMVLGRSNSFLFLYDCKAAKGGFKIDATAMRQFDDYVRNFHDRYEGYIGRLFAFVVISGDFKSTKNLADRSAELVSKCGARLVFLNAQTFGKMISQLAERPSYRQAIDWRRVFSRETVNVRDLNKQLAAIEKDGVIRRPGKK